MSEPPHTGERAPALELPRIDGGEFRLRDHRGRPLIVSFLRHAG